jgi:hypothetical protein
MSGVHASKNTSYLREILNDADNKIVLDLKQGSCKPHYVEVLAMGQAIGRSEDFKKLAAASRAAP